jgi:hypothetical protein
VALGRGYLLTTGIPSVSLKVVFIEGPLHTLAYLRTRDYLGALFWALGLQLCLGEITPSYILHTHAFGTYLLGGLFTLQKRL